MKLARHNTLLLLVLPVIFFISGLVIKSEVPFCYFYSVDPDYFYLFNGLNIAKLHLPWMIDHPGTPMQLFCAVIIRIVHLFRGDTLERDLFLNPELYLSAIRFSLILMHSAVLFFLGLLLSKQVKNTFIGILIQLTPFATYTVMLLMSRLAIENFFVTSVLLFILITFLYIYKPQAKEKFLDKYLMLFSLLAGFNLAVKLSFIPLCLIPLILLPGVKKKITYILLSIVSFGIFAFPIFARWESFSKWVINMFTHSGYYGAGEKKIIDLELYKENIGKIIHKDYLVVIYVSIFIIFCVIYHFKYFRIKRKNDLEYKGLLAITISIILMIILVSKMYNYWYLTPAFLLLIPGSFIIFNLIRRIINIKYHLVYYISVLFFASWVVFQFEYLVILKSHSILYNWGQDLKNNSKEVNELTKDKPLLICTTKVSSPYKEFGLYCGALMSGDAFDQYSSILKQLYPSVYIFHPYINDFSFWNKRIENSYTLADILKKNSNMYIMFGDSIEESIFMSRFYGINRQADCRFMKIYENKAVGTVIYNISYDSLKRKGIYRCDAEKLDSTRSFFVNEIGQKFENGNTQCNEKSRSGMFSCKLDKANPEGFSCILSEVGTGESFNISVWKFDNNNSGSNIQAILPDTVLTGILCEKYNNWIKLKIDIPINEKINGKNISINCFNYNQVIPTYFDDLAITKE